MRFSKIANFAHAAVIRNLIFYFLFFSNAHTLSAPLPENLIMVLILFIVISGGPSWNYIYGANPIDGVLFARGSG